MWESQRGARTHPQVHLCRVKFDGIERIFFCTGLPCHPCCYGSSSACWYFSVWRDIFLRKNNLCCNSSACLAFSQVGAVTSQLQAAAYEWCLLARSSTGSSCHLCGARGLAAPPETYGGLTDSLAPTCNAALGIREVSFATAGPQLTQEISSCVAFQQGDLSHTCCNSVKCIRYTIVMVNQHIYGI